MIDYDLTKIKAFAFDVDGVLSPSTIPMSMDGVPLRMVNIKDGFALQLAIKKNFHIAIITGGNTPAVQKRFEALGITDIYQSAAHKLPVLIEWLEHRSLTPEQVLYMGDDIPDLPAMHHVALPCAPHDAAQEVLSMARYISPRDGGYGAVRDVIEQTLRAQKLWMDNHESFGW